MATTVQQIDLWRQVSSERASLEFKAAKIQFDNTKLYEYCVAIANEGGGHLLLGIEDKPPRRVVGTAAFSNTVAMAEKLFNSVGFRVDIEEVAHPDGRVLVFHIPGRPRGTAYNLDGKYLMRSGSSLCSMSEDQLRKIFSEGKPDWLAEYSATGLHGSEVVELLDTQAYFELLGLPYPATQAGVLDRLCTEHLAVDEGGTFSVTRLAALLLAKRLSAFPDIAGKAPRVVAYHGVSKLKTRIDQIGTKGYAVGFQGLIQFVMSQLPQNEIVEDALRREVKLVPEIAVREIVANALIHQDLTVPGANVMIEIYDDRIEISNPGEPIVPVERFIDGYQSRNEGLADIMRRMGICEEKSSGIDQVVTAAEMWQLPAPDFQTAFRRTNVVVFGPRDFEDMRGDDRIRACYQHCVLKYVMQQRMTNETLRNRFRLSVEKSSTVSQIIAATIEAGMIKRDGNAGGSRKYARYLPFWA